eukprot:TRINITY_DN49449_c0_g1_i1.p1 TRINITY_DN49449_c0_g1~~TRINITY_DN49449_c0_g1_i1.p1  ORF type:complete len:195 (-),score=10.35 TRINITY_DN49449_c0_g1_i1:88-672(-)
MRWRRVFGGSDQGSRSPSRSKSPSGRQGSKEGPSFFKGRRPSKSKPVDEPGQLDPVPQLQSEKQASPRVFVPPPSDGPSVITGRRNSRARALAAMDGKFDSSAIEAMGSHRNSRSGSLGLGTSLEQFQKQELQMGGSSTPRRPSISGGAGLRQPSDGGAGSRRPSIGSRRPSIGSNRSGEHRRPSITAGSTTPR